MKRVLSVVMALVVLASTARLAAQENPRKGLNAWRLGSVPQELAAARELGVDTLRSELPWQQAQPGRDGFDWALTDAAVDAAGRAGVALLLTLRSVSSWGTRVPAQAADLYHHASAPRSLADWERFVGNLAARYRGRSVDYEIENEVNAAFWDGSLEEYLELLKASRRTIKAADPSAKVLCSAMACGVVFDLQTPRAQERFRERSDGWLKPILATGAFDVVNVHDYYFPSGITANGWTFSSYLAYVAGAMKQAGVSDRPVWITETGYVSRPTAAGRRTDEGSAGQQAQWLGQAWRQAREARVERVYWLLARDAPRIGYFASMGLTDTEGVRRPAWKAMAELKP